jgi:hypothetical protein
MADQFAQFQDAYPVMDEVPVESTAKGKSAFAEVFGDIEEKTANVAVALQKEQQDALTLTATDSLSKYKSQAQILMAQNPGMANEIVNQFKSNTANLIQGLPQKSRAKFQLAVDEAMGQTAVAAAKTDRKQFLLRTGVALDNTFPGALNAIRTSTDPKVKQQLINTLTSNITNAAMGGVISQGGYSKYMKQIHGIVDRDQKIQKWAIEGGATAAQAQAIYAADPTNSTLVQPNSPQDHNTKFMIDHYDHENTFESARADAVRGIYPDPNTLAKLPDKEFDTVHSIYVGALTEQGKFAANTHQTELETDLKNLKGQKDLSLTDQGRLSWLENHFNDQNNGKAYEQLTNTSAGATVLNNYNQKTSAINNAHYDNEADRQQDLNNELNIKRSQLISSFRASGVPIDKANIFSPTEQTFITDAFKKDADVSPVISSLYAATPNQNYFFAKSAASPEQRSALFLAGLQRNAAPNNPPNNFQNDILSANQTGKDYSQLKPGDNNEKLNQISSQIYGYIKPELQFIAMQPEGEANTGGDWANGQVKALVNYVKYRATQAGDFDFSHMSTYVSDAVTNLKKSYNITSGFNYNYNINEVPQINDKNAQDVTNYLIDQQLKKAQDRYGDTKANAAMDIFALQGVNTKDGQIALVDPTGHVVHHEPITSTLLAAAKTHSKEIDKLIQQHQIEENTINIGEEGPFEHGAL